MTAEQFLLDKWNSCIPMKHSDFPYFIVMVYEPIYIRQKKLNSLDNDKDIEYNITNNSKVLFIQDHKQHTYLRYSYSEIYIPLYVSYNLNHEDIESLIIKTIPFEHIGRPSWQYLEKYLSNNENRLYLI